MKQSALQFDEIAVWSELKLEILEKYGLAYTTAFKNSPTLKKYYIDGFSGAGVHRSKATGAAVQGSPVRALRISPPFDGYYFIDLDREKTDYLRKVCGDRKDVHIFTADCTQILTTKILPEIQYKNFKRALCLLDPYGLHLDWKVMLQAGRSRAVDMFLNFPVMDMNRNAFWKHPDGVPPAFIERMTKFWGDESWRHIAYAPSRQHGLFTVEMEKQRNEAIATAFRERLHTVAGFSFVPKPLAMRNSRNAVVYYLFFASQKPVAEIIISAIFRKYR